MELAISSIDGHVISVRRRGSADAGRVCIFAHGITMDKSENGLFDRAADALNAAGIATIQFDFRGHGESQFPSRAMTIRGEIFDLTAIIDSACDFPDISIVAASFGAVSTGLLPENVMSKLRRICLWYPVVSLKKTFLDPEFDWQNRNFGRDRIQSALASSGELLVGDQFLLGNGFLQEVEIYSETPMFANCPPPILVLHGDHDQHVSHKVANDFCEGFADRTFVPVAGSGHGFGRPIDEEFAISQTLKFISGAS